jgi:hypothetical protein
MLCEPPLAVSSPQKAEVPIATVFQIGCLGKADEDGTLADGVEVISWRNA